MPTFVSTFPRQTSKMLNLNTLCDKPTLLFQSVLFAQPTAPFVMQSFKEFFYRKLFQKSANQLLFEYEVYRLIPGTKNSYRQDSGNTNTLTQQHSHVFAKSHGKGAQLYAVNIDGSGHDGSSGTVISQLHADYFRQIGYSIPANNILESIEGTHLDSGDYSVIILDDNR